MDVLVPVSAPSRLPVAKTARLMRHCGEVGASISERGEHLSSASTMKGNVRIVFLIPTVFAVRKCAVTNHSDKLVSY